MTEVDRRLDEAAELAQIWLQVAQRRGYAAGHCAIAAGIIFNGASILCAEAADEKAKVEGR